MPIIKKSHKENIKTFCVETLPWLAVCTAGVVVMVVSSNKATASRTESYLESQAKYRENSDKAHDAYVGHLEQVYEHILEKR